MRGSRYRLWLLWLPLAAAVRMYWIAHGAPSYSSDTAILDLMARHLQHGAWSPYFWGQHYYGTLDSVLLAVLFAIAGQSIFVSQCLPLISWIVFLIVWHGYLSRSEDRATAELSTIFLAVGSPLLLNYTFTTYAYILILVLGVGHWILARRILDGDRTKTTLLWFGTLAGFSWYYFSSIVFFWGSIALTWWLPTRGAHDIGWLKTKLADKPLDNFWHRLVRLENASLSPTVRRTLTAINILNLFNLLIAILLWIPGDWQTMVGHTKVKLIFYPTLKISVDAAIVVAAIVHRTRLKQTFLQLFKMPSVRYVAAGFFIGYIPALVGMAMGQFPESPTKIVSGINLWNNLRLFTTQIVPAMIGSSGHLWLEVFSGALLVGGWVMMIRRLRAASTALKNRSFIGALWLINLVMTMTCIAMVDVGGARYLIPFLIASIVGIADLVVLAGRRNVFAGLVLGSMWIGNTVEAYHRALPGPFRHNEYEQFASDLAAQGIKGGYADYWIAYITTIASHEQVLITPTGDNERYRPYRDAVEKLDHPVWLTNATPAINSIVSIKARLYRPFNAQTIDGHTVSILK